MNSGRVLRNAIYAIAFLVGCAAPAPASREPDLKANRALVLAFYEAGLTGRQPRQAFERYVAADFVEHKPDVAEGTREATIVFLEELMQSMPDPRWEVIRTIAEGDLVFLHARFIPAAGAPAYAIADVFRVRDGRIVEHWDVVSGPPAEQRNPNVRF